MKLNKNFANLQESYLFSKIAKKVNSFTAENPNKKIIRLGIGDVTLPLVPVVIAAMQEAVAEMGDAKTFKGYGPEQGYSFLKENIQKYYKKRNINIVEREIFVSDGTKSDLGNILDLFDKENVALIPDPVYPVYVDTNRMAGRKIIFANATQENTFLPLPDRKVKADIIYLCSPNNPTGATYSKEQLKEWVEYALANHAIILYDAAYECFIQGKEIPRSIYEIEGAKECAIELCSFSKIAGFTGTRCAYIIVPEALIFDGMSCNKMWLRRQSTKSNGVSYIVQKGAAAVFTAAGEKQVQQNIAYYMENAKILANCMDALDIWYTGGQHSPYIWLKCPKFKDSWKFFDYLLEKANIVGTPGDGFGKNGKGYFRLTAFGDRENILEAVARLKKLVHNI